MKIAFFELNNKEQTYFKEAFNDHEVSCFEEKLDENNIDKISTVEILCVFINSEINQKIIDALPNLKLIVTRSTGFNHIDCDYLKTKGIKVANVPAYGSNTVAEFTFGLILNLSRNIIKANNYVRDSADFNYFLGMEGFDLKDKILGVIGTGKIGKNVIKIAKGFMMKVVAYDLHPDQTFAQENDFIYKSFSEVLAEADVLTLHAPYSKENHHLINKDNLSLVKKGVYLINTARGELIDTDALIWGLKEKIIAGAGLDVLEGEHELKEEIEILTSFNHSQRIDNLKTLLEDRVLMDMPNVIVTPHVAFYTREAVAEILKTTVVSIKGFTSGAPINLVN